MDVSFSAWKHSREESLQLKGDSFSFLFDRRYTNRLNRMSRVFFEAYVAATKELAMQEDRFPSLSEIDAKMESGAVYAFKDRLMKNTEFFEEVKISGVSYLVPRALRFVDSTGVYTDLILNFEEGTVILPTRRKTPSLAEPAAPSPDEEISPDLQAYAAEPAAEAVPQPLPLSKQKPDAYPFHSAAEAVAMESEEEQPPARTSLAKEDELPAPKVTTAASTPPSTPSPTPIPIPTPTSTPTPYSAPSSGKNRPIPPKKGRITREMLLALLLGAVILLAAGAYLLFNGDLNNGNQNNGTVPIVPTAFVDYSVYLFSSANESYLGFDISNPQGIPDEIEMKLPPNIDESISARGGVVTIAHGANTTVRMNTSTDASVKIYLLENWTEIPMTLSFATPEGYDTSLQLHNQDYYVTRRNDTLILNINLTEDGVNFEQSYIKRA